VEVRAGTPKPDISSVEAFKRALLNAKSVAYLKNGIESTYLDGLLEQLGIGEAVKPKLTRPESDMLTAALFATMWMFERANAKREEK
jgi:molybdate transport system substrate-binding protein